MTKHVQLGFWVGALGVVLSACAAPTPTPAAQPAASAIPVLPEPATANALDAGTANAPTPPAAADPPPVPPKPPEPEPEAEEKPSRPPIEILTSPDTAFLINYSGSAPTEAARKTCSEKAGADDDAIAKCMSDARAGFKADVLQFKRDGAHWSCVIYKRGGSRLDEVYTARVDLTEASPSAVKLKFTGAEKGMRVLFKTKRDTEIQVPNDYSLVITDPDLGRLIYEAKIGLVGS